MIIKIIIIENKENIHEIKRKMKILNSIINTRIDNKDMNNAINIEEDEHNNNILKILIIDILISYLLII